MAAAVLASAAIFFFSGCSSTGSSQPSTPRAVLEQTRKAARTKEDIARADLEQIPPPSKSRYLDVRSRDAYGNPFIEVHPDTVTLAILFPDHNPQGFGTGSMLRPVAARRQQVELRLADLPNALASLPSDVWPYGRVVAIAEPTGGPRAERVATRRNIEATIQMLNDLGVVVDEWTGTNGNLLH